MGLIIGGSITIVIGLFFFIAALIAQTRGYEIPIMKIFFEKSRLLWKDRVYIFYIVSGFLIIIAGIAMIVCSCL